MAFRDQNGRITIDEVAAQQDITRIQSAVESLQAADRLLEQISAQAAEFSGLTGTAILETAEEFSQAVRAVEEAAQETSETIRAVVQKYQAIDQSLKLAAESM